MPRARMPSSAEGVATGGNPQQSPESGYGVRPVDSGLFSLLYNHGICCPHLDEGMPALSDMLTVADLLALRQVSDAQIHPDGELTAYVVADPVVEFKQTSARSAIWLAGDTAEPRQLTAESTKAHLPRWSPDGTTLAFIGKRSGDETEQVHLLDSGWGEARELTSVNGDIESFQWSPDGRQLALLVTDPEPEEDQQRQKQGRDQIVYEDSHRYSRIWIYDASTGEARKLTEADIQIWEFAWSPDGSRLAAIVSSQPYNWCWYQHRLALVDAGTGDITTIYEPPKTITRPVWSPAADRVAMISCLWSDQGMTGGDVVVLDVADGRASNLTEGQPRSYTAVEWTSDGGFVGVAVEDARLQICTLDAGGTCDVLWSGEAAISYYGASIFSRDSADQQMAVVRSDPGNPGDVWLFDLPSREWQQLTTVNPQVAGKTMHSVETLHWSSFDGLRIHGLLVRPAGSTPDQPLPMIVLIHGGPTGVSGYDFPSHRTAGWAHLLASEGYAVLLPNPRGSMGFGTEFAEANIGDMGGADLADILAGVDYCVESGIADPDRLGVGGWSYGGYLTSWVVTQTQRFKAAIAGATITNWTSFHGSSTIHQFDQAYYRSDPYNADGIYTFRSPIYHVREATTPVLFLHGEQDPICPTGQAHEMWRALTELGVDTRLVIYPREGHGPREREHVVDLLERVVAWYTRYV